MRSNSVGPVYRQSPSIKDSISRYQGEVLQKYFNTFRIGFSVLLLSVLFQNPLMVCVSLLLTLAFLIAIKVFSSSRLDFENPENYSTLKKRAIEQESHESICESFLAELKKCNNSLSVERQIGFLRVEESIKPEVEDYWYLSWLSESERRALKLRLSFSVKNIANILASEGLVVPDVGLFSADNDIHESLGAKFRT